MGASAHPWSLCGMSRHQNFPGIYICQGWCITCDRCSRDAYQLLRLAFVRPHRASRLYAKCPMTAAQPNSKCGLFRIPRDTTTNGLAAPQSKQPLTTTRMKSICVAGYGIRWLSADGQKWVHGKDLCDALGYHPSDVNHVQDRTASAISLGICELPPHDRLVSREGVELLMNGCWGDHASAVAHAVCMQIYQDPATSAIGTPSWEDHERERAADD
jgi:hypothetical protein